MRRPALALSRTRPVLSPASSFLFCLVLQKHSPPLVFYMSRNLRIFCAAKSRFRIFHNEKLLSASERRAISCFPVLIWFSSVLVLAYKFRFSKNLRHYNLLILYHVSIFFANLMGARLAPITLSFLEDRKSTRLNSSHMSISYAVFCLKN